MPRDCRENQKSYTGVYHVILRSINQQEIFYDNTDRRKFLKCLKETKEKYHYDLYAYVLMHNHVHLVIMDKEDKLSKAIQSLAISYALYFNKKYNRIGHVFYNRFKSKYVENLPYLLNIIRYIHFNPEKAGMCKYSKFCWSSYHEYSQFSRLIETEKVLKMAEMSKKDFENFHVEYERIKGYEKEEFEIENVKVSDEQAIEKIKELLHIENIVSIQNEKVDKRDKIIAEIISKMKIEKRQLATKGEKYGKFCTLTYPQ
ncbi:MAG: transposase [Clostridia bacterium]|nr:transposase [Clostridia bacterium]